MKKRTPSEILRKRPAGWRGQRVRRRLYIPKAPGLGAYRYVISGGRVHAKGPDGRRCELLEFYAERRLASSASRPAALRDIKSVFVVINACHPKRSNVLETLLRDRHAARETVREALELLECVLEPGEGRNAGWFIRIEDPARAYAVSITINALRVLYEILFDAGIYVDHNPISMDPGQSRLAALATEKREHGEDGQIRSDTDRYFRVRGGGRHAPRTNNPYFLKEILEAGEAFGWHPAVTACIQTKGLTGGRDFQTRAATLHWWLVLGGGEFISAPNKGKRGRRRVRLRLPKALLKLLHALMDATYEGGMEALRALARTKAGRKKLMRMPIFTTDGVSEITYDYLNNENFRPAIEAAGLRVLDYGDGESEPVLKWITMHMLRHEFTNAMLDRIEASAVNEADKLVQQVRLANYMGWKSAQAMLRYYGAWHFNRQTDLFVAALQEAANDNSAPAFADEYEAAALNDNDRAELDRVAGGLFW